MTHGKPSLGLKRLGMSDAASAARPVPEQSVNLHGAGA
jgi:hypothetical protein